MTTGFIIEAQKNLKEDPANTAVVFLGKILQQLNQTVELTTETEPFTSATTIDKLINAFWFTSLAFSLATVTIGLLCLQWIQEYKKDGDHLSHEEYFNFRYVREQGFKYWHAKAIIASLPLLLIFSLLTFFGGLLVFLGTSNWAVAVPVYAILLLTFTLLIFTTLLPGIIAVRKALSVYRSSENPALCQDDGVRSPPFRSLQSWLALKMTLRLASFYYRGLQPIRTLRQYQDWVRVDVRWAKWSQDLCRMSIRPLLILFSGSTEKNTAATCRTLDEFASNVWREKEWDRDTDRVFTFQLQAFPLATNLCILHEKSPQCTEASRVAWIDHLVERYHRTAALWFDLSDSKKLEDLRAKVQVEHAVWQFKCTLADMRSGQGNLSKPPILANEQLIDRISQTF